MKINDILKQTNKTINEIKIKYMPEGGFPFIQQGTKMCASAHVNYTHITCTDENDFKKFLESDFFTPTEFFISSHEKNNGEIVGFTGHLLNKGYYFRKGLPKLTQEERLRRATAAKERFTKNKQQ